MIDLLINYTQRILNGLELMKEFDIKPNYTQVMLLNQMISGAKHIIDHHIAVAGLNEDEDIIFKLSQNIH